MIGADSASSNEPTWGCVARDHTRGIGHRRRSAQERSAGI